jgi:tetratricopeptide (TPR) repeat protein
MHLVDCYKQQQQSQALTHVLYRGQRMMKKDFEKIRQNKGGLLSVSSFLSTSENSSLARIYAGLSNDVEEAILLEINIDHDLGAAATSPFANIQALSHFGQDEKEWLFSLGPVFRITGIKKAEINGPWSVCLLLTNEYDQQLNSITKHYQNDILIGLISPIHSLAKLTYKMGNYRSALEYYQLTLDSATLWRIRSLILHEIGNSNERLAFYENALSYYEQALEIK